MKKTRMKKKITRAVWLLTTLAMLASLCACGAGEIENSAAPSAEETEPPITTPVPTPHVHSWENGVCTNCGESCTHHWDSGVCRICGMACPHEYHDPNTGLCSACLMPVGHDYVNLVCTRCGEGPAFVETTTEYPADAAARRTGKESWRPIICPGRAAGSFPARGIPKPMKTGRCWTLWSTRPMAMTRRNDTTC